MNLIDQIEDIEVNNVLAEMIKGKDPEKDAASINKVKEEFLNRSKNFTVGDLVKVNVRIVEGKRERIQIFEGYVISFKGSGITRSVKIRKSSFGVGVERTFPLYSPKVESFNLIRRGRVRRAKLYYLRKRTGKKSQIREDINFKTAE